MTQDLQERMKEYEEGLNARVGKGTHVPENRLGKILVWFALTGFVAVSSFMTINYLKHNGPQKFVAHDQTKGVAKVTGVTTFVEYRKFENISVREFKIQNEDVDVLVKGSLFGKAEAYLDAKADGEVEWIHYYDRKPNLHRTEDYAKNKKLFDKADREIVKYKLGFSK